MNPEMNEGVISDLEELSELRKKNEELRLRLLSAAGDDLCRLSQEEIKELSSGGVKIPPKEEFLASCERFHKQIASGPGVLTNCLTLAQLIAENEKLSASSNELKEISERLFATGVRNFKTPLQGVSLLCKLLGEAQGESMHLRRRIHELLSHVKTEP